MSWTPFVFASLQDLDTPSPGRESRSYLAPVPLNLVQANALIAAAHDHAADNDWKIAVAVVDEGGLLVALGRMDGAFPLAPQIAEAKAAGAALWHRDGERLAASRDSHEGFFDAVSKLVRLPLIPGPGSVVIRDAGSVLGAAGASGASGDDDRACVEAGLRAVLPEWAPS
jgi:glc operon protein GlcG